MITTGALLDGGGFRISTAAVHSCHTRPSSLIRRMSGPNILYHGLSRWVTAETIDIRENVRAWTSIFLLPVFQEVLQHLRHLCAGCQPLGL